MGKVKEEQTPQQAEGKTQSLRNGRFATRQKADVFQGRQEGLEDAIFECDRPEHTAQFKTTLKELALFVEREYNGGKT